MRACPHPFAVLFATNDLSTRATRNGRHARSNGPHRPAERIIVELRDRVDALGGGVPGISLGGAVPHDPVSEASVALQQLGYKPAEISRLVKDAAAPGDSAEAIIRKALRAALR